MRHEDIPRANEYERGLLIQRRKPHASPLAPKIGGTELVQLFLSRLVDQELPFTRLKIESSDKRVSFNLQRKPGRVNFYASTLTDQQKDELEKFCARKGIELFTEHAGYYPWPSEPIVGCAFNGDYIAVFGSVIELLTHVYGAKEDEKYRFVLL